MGKVKDLRNMIVNNMYSYVDNLDNDERDEVLEELDESLKDLVAEVEMKIRMKKNKDCGTPLKKVTIWSNIIDAGDGSVYLLWLLTELDAKTSMEKELDLSGKSWSEDSIQSAETYIGSDIYNEAVKNSKELLENWDN